MRKVLLTLVVLFVAVAGMAQEAKPQGVMASTSNASAPGGANTPLPTEETVNVFLHKMFGYQESLTWKVTSIAAARAAGLAEVNVVFSSPQGQQQGKFYVTPDGQHAVMGDLIPFGADPFAETRAKLAGSQTGLAKGPEDAKLVLVEFADLQCPGCKAAQGTITRLQEDYPNARFVFQNYPLENLHPWAMLAAKYVDCVGRNAGDKLWDFMTQVYDHQAQITAENAEQRIPEYAQAAGVDTAKISACVQSPDTYVRIQKSIDLAKSVQVTSTPTLFVNGRKVAQLVGAPYETVKQIVQFEAEDAK
jgi:protein-disulfide isomerase